jgi:hypothetical protein
VFKTFLEWKNFLGTLCSSNMQICSIDSIEEQSRFLQFRIPFAALFDFSCRMNWLNCFKLHWKRNITLSCTVVSSDIALQAEFLFRFHWGTLDLLHSLDPIIGWIYHSA